MLPQCCGQGRLGGCCFPLVTAGQVVFNKFQTALWKLWIWDSLNGLFGKQFKVRRITNVLIKAGQ